MISDIVENKEKYNLRSFSLIKSDDFLFFLAMRLSAAPTISVSFVIDKQLNVKIYRKEIPQDLNQFSLILGSEYKYDLYSKLENLITYLINTRDQISSEKDEINLILVQLQN